MATLHMCLFGKFSAVRVGRVLEGLDAPKIQQLFSYLLLHREHPLPRETLASLFWPESSTAQSKKCLRQALWQLQTAVELDPAVDIDRVLLTEHDWVQINPAATIWLDIDVFERAVALSQGVSGEQLEAPAVLVLRQAVELYEGDLLEGWYDDWCLYERERLQNMYMAMLDKLMGYCEAHHEYEAGLRYGTRILRYDRAHERTHRRLMRLYYLAGDRVAALRQYQRCATTLREEFGVQPASRTLALYKQIQADQLQRALPALVPLDPIAATADSPLSSALARLELFSNHLIDLQRQVYEDIQTLKAAVDEQGEPAHV